MKTVILKLDGNWTDIKPIIVEAITNGLNHFLIPPEFNEKVRELGNVKLYAYSSDKNPEFIIVPEEKWQKDQTSDRENLILEFIIKSNEDLDKILENARQGIKHVLVSSQTWKVIPLENLIADLQ